MPLCSGLLSPPLKCLSIPGWHKPIFYKELTLRARLGLRPWAGKLGGGGAPVPTPGTLSTLEAAVQHEPPTHLPFSCGTVSHRWLPFRWHPEGLPATQTADGQGKGAGTHITTGKTKAIGRLCGQKGMWLTHGILLGNKYPVPAETVIVWAVWPLKVDSP